MRNILIAGMLLLCIVACKQKSPANQSIANAEPVVVELSITGMSCMGCVETVRSSIAQLQGIDSVAVSLEKNNAMVTFVPSVTDSVSIRKAVELNGYKVVKTVPMER